MKRDHSNILRVGINTKMEINQGDYRITDQTKHHKKCTLKISDSGQQVPKHSDEAASHRPRSSVLLLWPLPMRSRPDAMGISFFSRRDAPRPKRMCTEYSECSSTPQTTQRTAFETKQSTKKGAQTQNGHHDQYKKEEEKTVSDKL